MRRNGLWTKLINSEHIRKEHLTKKDAEAALNGFIKSVEESLADGNKVQLVGFGTFEVRERKS